MTRVWFVVPVHGREELTRVCLRHLERTCKAAPAGMTASAVVIGDDSSVDYAEELGFATVRRDNDQLGRKFNDGYQLACDPEYNPEPADYVIPCGSDDWVDPVILRTMPPSNTVGIFRLIAVVNEDHTTISRLKVGYQGGCGVRIIPASWVARCGYRPAEEDVRRGCDTSALMGMYAVGRVMPKMAVLDVHPLQIVDWKSHGQQLNSYRAICSYRRGDDSGVWGALAEHYPADALADMRALDAELFAA